MRQASSVGHLASLGRLSLGAASHDALVTAAAAAAAASSAPPPRRPASGDMGYAGGTLVKRSKSLWKFKRSKDDDILAGMALWQHRSLIDVNAAVEAEPVNGKSNGHAPVKAVSSTNGTTPTNDDVTPQNGHTPSNGHTPTNGHSPTNGHTPTNGHAQMNGTAGPKVRRRDVDDGLMMQREMTTDDEDSATEMGDSDSSVSAEDSESCIVVDDHMRESSLKRRRQQYDLRRQELLQQHQEHQQQPQPQARGRITTLDEPESASSPANILPRTRLVKSRQNGHGGSAAGQQRPQRRNRVQNGAANGTSPTSDGAGDGLLHYGRSLQKRLSKPDRGSRFDQKSETTGNRCGPWYDLWGMDASVAH